LCLSQARTWIYNIICHGLFCVDIVGIVKHNCLNFLFIKSFPFKF
jgi:hypothetical protein